MSRIAKNLPSREQSPSLEELKISFAKHVDAYYRGEYLKDSTLADKTGSAFNNLWDTADWGVKREFNIHVKTATSNLALGKTVNAYRWFEPFKNSSWFYDPEFGDDELDGSSNPSFMDQYGNYFGVASIIISVASICVGTYYLIFNRK